MTFRRLLPLSLLLGSFAACSTPGYAPPTPPPELGTVVPQIAAVVTQGMTIRAADGSWGLVGGTNDQPPFVQRSYPHYSFDDVIGMADAFVAAGAQPVYIDYPGMDEPLYGVLSLMPVYESGDYGAQRTYKIELPADKVHSATGGLVSVVYSRYVYEEPITAEDMRVYDHLSWDTWTHEDHRRGYSHASWGAASWILWVSDAPFFGHG